MDQNKAKLGIYPKCAKCKKTKYYIAPGYKTCDKCRGRTEDLNHLSVGAVRICNVATHTQEEMRDMLGYGPVPETVKGS